MFFFFKKKTPCISPVVVLVGRPFVRRTVDWLHFVHLFRRRHYRIRHCRWRIFVAQHCKYKVNITSWNSWTILYFILSVLGGSCFSFETSSSYHLHHAFLNTSQNFYPQSLARFFLSAEFILNDVLNKDRWQTSNKFSRSAIVRRSSAKTVRTGAGNLSLPLIFSAGLSHPSYSNHTTASTNHSIRCYSPTVHLQIPSPYPHNTVAHYEVWITLLFHNFTPPLTPTLFSNHTLIFKYYIICTAHRGLFAVLV